MKITDVGAALDPKFERVDTPRTDVAQHNMGNAVNRSSQVFGNQKGGMMKPEQQRIAIAEACGTMRWSYALPKKCVGASVPDYLNDLNAMHEAEKILIRPNLYAKGGWGMYLSYLSTVTEEQHPIDATAAQRAEAFLRTIGKWEGE